MTNYNLASTADGKALNSLGRSTGRQFNMAAIKRELCGAKPTAFDETKFEAKRQKRDRKPVVLSDLGGR